MPLAPPYTPRRPQETVLYALVREHLGDFLDHVRETYEGPLPRYVVEEFVRTSRAETWFEASST